jgi:tryptophanyl-tRNA synthetase
MHQFKTKGDKMLGLLSYPVLQAADILLYQANIVPVGQDQSQHMNLTTDIAKSFNSKYGNVFVVPKGMYGTTQSMRIMSLREPVKKMSKSDKTEMSRIDIIDSAEVIKTKIRKATTDSIQGVTYDPNRPGIANLLDIYFAIQETSGTVEELNSIVVKEFGSKTTRELKEIVGDCVIDHLEPIRTRYQELQRNQDEIDLILEDGECKAREIAQETMDRVSTALGLK